VSVYLAVVYMVQEESSEGAHQGGGAVPPTFPAAHHLHPARSTDGT
jgi:hypothetical protein